MNESDGNGKILDGMLLSGIGSCTAIVLHTYAQHHGVDLREVELHLTYDRVFAEDCVECEDILEYREQIDEQIVLTGDLTPQERNKLFLVSKHCPIHKMLIQGIEVRSHLEEHPRHSTWLAYDHKMSPQAVAGRRSTFCAIACTIYPIKCSDNSI
jgi:uncharacterized OsmC-like protein